MFDNQTDKDAFHHRVGDNLIRQGLGFDPEANTAGMLHRFSGANHFTNLDPDPAFDRGPEYYKLQVRRHPWL